MNEDKKPSIYEQALYTTTLIVGTIAIIAGIVWVIFSDEAWSMKLLFGLLMVGAVVYLGIRSRS